MNQKRISSKDGQQVLVSLALYQGVIPVVIIDEVTTFRMNSLRYFLEYNFHSEDSRRFSPFCAELSGIDEQVLVTFDHPWISIPFKIDQIGHAIANWHYLSISELLHFLNSNYPLVVDNVVLTSFRHQNPESIYQIVRS